MSTDIVKAGLLVIRDNRMLLCRKSRDTSLLIVPGGKLDPGESDEACLRREVAEELGPTLEIQNITYTGTYRDVAAGAEHRTVEVRLYQGDLSSEPAPHAEIAELIWFAPTDDPSQLSATLRNKILPDLLQRGILNPPAPLTTPQ
ncbi:MAG: NUDIX domain-containing protein [Bryobacteraceae bacterium]|nr:NUDIX domain-containing protein [Bryobacteraceae bacterium]